VEKIQSDNLTKIIKKGMRYLVKARNERRAAWILFCLGTFIIILSVLPRFFGLLIAYVSLFENIGAALIIPFLVLKVTEWVSKKEAKIHEEKPEELPPLIKDMESEFLRMGISLSDIWACETSSITGEDFRKSILKADPKRLGEILKNNKVYTAITEKARESKTRLSFKFLFLDPDSEFLTQREINEDGKKSGRLKEEVECTQKVLKAIEEAISVLGSSIEFKYHTYNFLPTISLICVDKRMFIGPYLYGKQGYKTPWIEFSGEEESEAYLEYKNAFEDIWNKVEAQNDSKK